MHGDGSEEEGQLTCLSCGSESGGMAAKASQGDLVSCLTYAKRPQKKGGDNDGKQPNKQILCSPGTGGCDVKL